MLQIGGKKAVFHLEKLFFQTLSNDEKNLKKHSVLTFRKGSPKYRLTPKEVT
jgi:hypothetical protein